MSQATTHDFFKSKVLGHPSGLFVLFFTEMWERFSFYGMRVLLINFLTMAAVGANPGWGWSSENAGALFGTYAGLLYITPIIGGIIADKVTGYRVAVVIGALIMTLGHAAMALETEFWLYTGLALLVIGTGFFKPNITSIISEMYKDLPEKKDGAYTIFYMGVNAGAFFGMMLCGYLAEKIGWSWGFGLAGIFMLLGSLQFWLAGSLFGNIGAAPKKESSKPVIIGDTTEVESVSNSSERTAKQLEKRNPFTIVDKVLIVICSIIGLLYLINDPVSKIGNVHLLPQEFLLSKDILSGPSVIIILGLVLFLILTISRIVRYDNIIRDRMIVVIIFVFFTVFFVLSFEQGATSLVLFARDFTDRQLVGSAATVFNIVNSLLTVVPLIIISWVLIKLFRQTYQTIKLSNIILGLAFIGIWGLVIWMLVREFYQSNTEITVSWFSILNSFFIIAFASIVSKIWESKFNISAPVKFGLGLVITAIGFALLAFGSNAIPSGAAPGSIRVSMIWLILAYLFHTLGELCIQPVGLSYVSKLVPGRMIAFMFGMWYLAIAIGNKLAGTLGGEIEKITSKYDMTTFFLIFTVVPAVAGLIIMALSPAIKKLMHGVK
jgi:POT family proton-dependent oligopeptide transporter